jgi:carboxypeptidase C (cathepsin A)
MPRYNLTSRLSLVAALAAAATQPLSAQGRRGGAAGDPAQGQPAAARAGAAGPAVDADARPFVPRRPEDTLVVTHGLVRLPGGSLPYTAQTGMLPIRNQQTGENEGWMFYVYYAKDGVLDPATRPVTFVFNGGPGSATVWLHMGAFGPKRVKLNEDGSNPPPPYTWEDNPHTLLDQTDLVFLDPVGTGYSRATSAANGPKFWGLDEDMRAAAEFIRLFLTRNERWASPRFIAGESYGTTRAAHLSGYMTDNGMGLNGVILLSTVLNFENLRPDKGNDIAYVGFFPSFAMTAWYHKKVAPDLQAMTAEQFARAAEQFTNSEYEPALYKGAAMTAAESQAIAAKISRFTGMPTQWVLDNDLRIPLGRFSTELLRDKRQMTGRLDSRFAAFNPDPDAGTTAFDPSDASIRLSFTPVLNDYMRRVLNYDNDNMYYILGGGIGPWRYEEGRFANVVPSLERAFNRNPYMKLYVAMGYYDMATTYWSVQYTLDHMTLDPKIRAGIKVGHFEAGHMMYIDRPSMAKLRAELRAFYDGAVAR